MKKQIHFLMVCFTFIICLVGCGIAQNNGNDLQRLAQIDIYSSDGNLTNSITDEDTLCQFYNLSFLDTSTNKNLQQNELTSNLDVLYTVIAYKTPAAIFNDGALIKTIEITVYSDSNIVKEQISPEIIKSFPIAEEDLAYYFEASKQDIEFILSLVKNEE